MKLPQLNEIPTQRDFIGEFKGYNHNLRIGENEFYDMKNLTSDYYPVLSPRKKRGFHLFEDPKAPNNGAETVVPSGGIGLCKNQLFYIDQNGDFCINDQHFEMGLDAKGEKKFVSMGAYVIILPDKKWISTITYEHGDIEAEFKTTGGVSFTMCKLDGSEYKNKLADNQQGNNTDETTKIPVQDDAPANPKNMDYWIDTSSDPHALKQWSESSSMWVSVPTTYVKITSVGIGANFEKYDGITIEGLMNNQDKQLAALNGSAVVWDKGEDYIVVVGILDNARIITDEITISRKMPDMDFIVESDNRLFGCNYGYNANGDFVNEIYASKLGDFKNWNCFMGLSTDSYAASCGTKGRWTGAISYLGHPLFFKEKCMHKVYGNYPANFQIQITECEGVQEGSGKSLAIVNNVLYYKSPNGICAYDGSLPVDISYPLGKEYYNGAVACAHNDKYYISMSYTDAHLTPSGRKNMSNHLFVYDTTRMLWHKEDDLYIAYLCSYRDQLCFVERDEKDKSGFKMGIKTLTGGVENEESVTWMAESGVLGMYTPDRKYISKLNIRASLDVGTKVRVYIQYDSCGEWELVSNLISTSIRSFSVPIRPRRCDHFKIKIEGDGDGKIYSISKTLEEGSDV